MMNKTMFSLDPMFSSKSRSTDTLAVLDIGTNEVKIVVVSTPSVSVAATNLILQIGGNSWRCQRQSKQSCRYGKTQFH